MQSRLKIEVTVGAILLVLGLYFGNRHGKVNEKLATNAAMIKRDDKQTKVDIAKSDSLERKSDKSVAKHEAETKVVYVQSDSTLIVHDTVVKVDTAIVNRIKVADSTVKDLRATLMAKDLTIADLQRDIKDRDDRIKLLSPSHVSRGLQVGIGGCYGGHGVQPCAYVGYGVEFR